MTDKSKIPFMIGLLANVEWTNIEKLDTELPEGPFKDIGFSFSANMNRMGNLARLAPYFAGKGYELQRLQCLAEEAAFGKVRWFFDDEGNEEQIKKLNSEYERLLDKYDSEFTGQQRYDRHTLHGYKLVDLVDVMDDAHPFVSAMRGLLSSIVLGSWTAFEVMTADLWELALNTYPKGLADLDANKGTAKPKRGEDQEDDDHKKIGLNQLQKYGYDLSNKMGTVLKDKFSFTKLDGIRKAYAAAFDNRYKNLHAIVEDKALEHMAAYRNVLIHKGGKADTEFCRQVSSHPTLKEIVVGEHLPLHGEIVLEQMQMIVNKAELISAVFRFIEDRRKEEALAK